MRVRDQIIKDDAASSMRFLEASYHVMGTFEQPYVGTLVHVARNQGFWPTPREALRTPANSHMSEFGADPPAPNKPSDYNLIVTSLETLSQSHSEPLR